jgi:hypothetical protein
MYDLQRIRLAELRYIIEYKLSRFTLPSAQRTRLHEPQQLNMLI